MLDQITPVILTYNEVPNITRTLEKLYWANDIVVVDSGSNDGTDKIVQEFPNVRLFTRPFVSHPNQWNYAIHETGINTNWVLALDADYIISDELIDEMKGLQPDVNVKGYQVEFTFCIEGKALRGSLYPAVTVLYQKDLSKYSQDGHTQRVKVKGDVKKLKNRIYHDDRKPIGAWLGAQDRYMQLECQKIINTNWKRLSPSDRIRKLRIIAPFMVFFYCLLIKQGILDGRAGFYYALQRTVAEFILSLHLLLHDLRFGVDNKTGIRDDNH